MKKVYFWQGVMGDPAVFEEFQPLIEALLSGRYRAIHLEKLHAPSRFPIYSIRNDDDTRLLFTTHARQACLLEVIRNHDYAKSRFLRVGVDGKILSRFIAQTSLAQVETTHTFQNTDEVDLVTSVEPDESLEFVGITYYQNQWIEFSPQQNQALRTHLPAAIYGPAGSGKSCVALSMLSHHASFMTDEMPPALYATQSTRLLKKMEKFWRELTAHAPELSKKVHFKTYRQLMNLSDKLAPATETDFQNWIQLVAPCHKGGSSLASALIESIGPDGLWREFRIRSGYTPKEYLELGRRQSELQDDSREVVNQLFQRYLEYLTSRGLMSSELSIPAIDAHFSLIVVDEAQDFSYLQLKVLDKLAHHHIAYLLGDHQILFDGFSRLPFIKHMFHQLGVDVAIVQLPSTYRCSKPIVDLANEIINLKYEITGGAVGKNEALRMEMDPLLMHQPGEIKFISPSDTAALSAYKTLKHNRNVALVSEIDFRHIARALSDTPLHFTTKEIKGLEYQTVILVHPFNHPDFQEAAKKLPRRSSGAAGGTGHRAKQSTETNPALIPTFDALITAITRARNSVIIVQPWEHDLEPIRERLQHLFPSTPTESIPPTPELTPLEIQNHWKEEASRLMEEGLETQARDICREKLSMTDAELDNFIKEHRESSPSPTHAAPSPHSPDMSTFSEPLLDVQIPKKDTYQKVKTDFERCLIPQNIKDFRILKLLLKDPLWVNNNYCQTWLFDKLLNFDLDCKEKSVLFYLCTSQKGIQRLLQLQAEFESIFNQIPPALWKLVLESPEVIPSMAQYVESVSILNNLLMNIPECFESVPINHFKNKIPLLSFSTLYVLTLNDLGIRFLINFQKKYPQKFIELSAMDWSEINGTDPKSRMTPFLKLFATEPGFELCSILLRSDVTFFAKLSEDTKAGLSLFINMAPTLMILSASKHGITLLESLHYSNPAILEHVPHLSWISKSVHHPSAHRECPLSQLTRTLDGIHFLFFLFERSPKILKRIPQTTWSQPIMDGETMVHRLMNTHKPYGVNLLALIVRIYGKKVEETIRNIDLCNQFLLLSTGGVPSLTTESTASARLFFENEAEAKAFFLESSDWKNNDDCRTWLSEALQKSEGDDLLLFDLCLTCKGFACLYELWVTEKQLFNLIPAKAWQRVLSAPDVFSHFVHHRDSGHILNALLLKYPGCISAIPTSNFIYKTDIIEKGTFSSPLFWLSAHDRGRQFLMLLLRNLPEKLHEIPIEAWSEPTPKTDGIGASPFYILFMSQSDDKTGIKFYMTLLKNYPEFFIKLPESAWTEAPEENERTTPLHMLSATPEGIEFLEALNQCHPSIFKKINGALWSQVTPFTNPLSPLHCLSSSPQGIQFMTGLIRSNPVIWRQIPVYFWTARSKKKELTLLERLTNSEAGIEFIHHEAREELIPLLVNYLDRLHSFQPRESNVTFLFVLAEKACGCLLLMELLHRNPQMMRPENPKLWTSRVRKDTHDTNVIFELAMKEEGRQFLLELYRICPNIIHSIPPSLWGAKISRGEMPSKSFLFCLAESSTGSDLLHEIVLLHPETLLQIPPAAWADAVLEDEGHSSTALSWFIAEKIGQDDFLKLIRDEPRFLFKIPIKAWEPLVKTKATLDDSEVAFFSFLVERLKGSKPHQTILDSFASRLTDERKRGSETSPRTQRFFGAKSDVMVEKGPPVSKSCGTLSG